MTSPTDNTSTPVTVTDATFDELVLASKVPVLVDFWASWCPPCRALAPVLEQVAAEVGDAALIVKVDTDANPALSERFSISSIPSLIFFSDGEEQHRTVGVAPAAELVARLAGLGTPTVDAD